MRPSLALKSLLRAPFKTFMTLLLIATATFAIFYRVVDFTVTQREIKRVNLRRNSRKSGYFIDDN
jgi:HAMP domain-containing protein